MTILDHSIEFAAQPGMLGDMQPRTRSTALMLAVALLLAGGAAGSADAATGARAKRIAPPVAPPPGGGPHSFMMTEPGSSKPVTYSPCQRIRYVVNAARQPAGADGVVASAIKAVQKYSGLRFRYLGTTRRQPSRNGEISVTPAPGKKYPPVLIAWTTPKRVPALQGSVAGEGGSTAVSSGSSSYMHYVTGQVTLDSADIAKMLKQGNGRALARAIVMHELGHVVGLDHVQNRRQIMSPVNVGQTTWGKGDRTGLAMVGRGRCVA